MNTGPAYAVAFGVALLASQAIAQRSAQTPDTISADTIDQLKAGHTKTALGGFFGDNPLMAGKQNELSLLESQKNSGFSIYGPIRACELAETSKRGTLVEYRLYLCQHDHSVSRWRFLFVHTAKGWTGSYIAFDDKATLPLDQN